VEAPNFAMKEVVVAALERASDIATGSVTRAAAVVFAIILGLHIAEGAAELATRQPCRFFDSRWWLRLVLVITLMAGYKRIVVGVGMSWVPVQMLAYTTSWVEVWDQEWDAIDAVRKSEEENKKLRKTEMEQQSKATSGGGGSWWQPVVTGFWTVLDGLVSVLGLVIAVVVGVGLCLLMLVQAFWVLGLLLLLVAIGPLCIAFALHPATSSIFWAFFRQILVYEFLYLPFLGIACSIAGVVMGRVSSTFAGSGIAYADGTNVAVHLLMAVLGPLCSFAVVKGAPFALQQLFAGGDGGGAGGSLAGKVGERLTGAGKGIAALALGAGGGADGGGGASDAAGTGGSGDGGEGVSAQAARGEG
jgi:hypothetical protein